MQKKILRVGSSMPMAFVYSAKYIPVGIHCYCYFLLRKENQTETDGDTPMKSTMLISIRLRKSRGLLFPNNESSLTFSLNFFYLLNRFCVCSVKEKEQKKERKKQMLNQNKNPRTIRYVCFVFFFLKIGLSLHCPVSIVNVFTRPAATTTTT